MNEEIWYNWEEMEDDRFFENYRDYNNIDEYNSYYDYEGGD